MSGKPLGIGDQGAQQRHLLSREVAPVIAALDLAVHSGTMSLRLRRSLIDHGSQVDRSSGGLPPFFAHAVSHASSQRRTSAVHAELGYGLEGPRDSGAMPPYAGLTLAEDVARSLRLGARWAFALALTLGFEGRRHEPVSAGPAHALVLRATARW